MSEERVEVLKLVADKVITVEEAERLLRALDEGERQRSEPPPRSERRASSGFVAGAFDGMGEALGAIGEVVETALGEALQGVEVGLGLDEDDAGAPSGPLAFELPQGARVAVRLQGFGATGAELRLLPSEDGRCVVEAEPGADVWTRLEGERAKIRARRGTVTVRVPAAAAAVDARVVGAELRVKGLGCRLEARTVGGGLSASGLRAPFDVRCTGGELVLALDPALRGDSRVATTGGEVTLTIPDALPVHLDATCTGATVRVDPGLGSVRREGRRYQGRVVLDAGAEDVPRATIEVKSVGGDVRVKREAE